MKRIIVTPAGREKYLQILVEYLIRDYNHGYFDEYHLWVNTDNQKDIKYIQNLEKTNSFIKCIYRDNANGGNRNIRKFFNYCIDPNTLYLRFDDDIVFVEEEYIDNIFRFREANTQNFLIFGNIINNSIISYMLQQKEVLDQRFGQCNGTCMDKVGWKTPEFAEYVNETFFKYYHNQDLDKLKFSTIEFDKGKRFSINSIAWRGSDFAEFGGKVSGDEERWLTHDYPSNKSNCIYGEHICSHFAFFTQREYLEKNTDILTKYHNLAPQLQSALETSIGHSAIK